VRVSLRGTNCILDMDDLYRKSVPHAVQIDQKQINRLTNEHTIGRFAQLYDEGRPTPECTNNYSGKHHSSAGLSHRLLTSVPAILPAYGNED